MLRLIPRLSSIVPLCFLAGCAMPDEQEVAVMQTIPRIEKDFGGIYADPALQRYIAEIGQGAARFAMSDDAACEFKVLNSEQVNAFALPGGKIYVTRGLLSRLENEAQLAAILSHEIAHVARGHTAQQLQRVQAAQDGAAMAAIVGGFGGGQSNPFVAGRQRFSREQEKEADLYGLNYLARQGYDPRAALRTMDIFQYACGDQRPEASSTHPSSDNRRQYLQEEITRRYARFVGGKTNQARYRQIVFQKQ